MRLTLLLSILAVAPGVATAPPDAGTMAPRARSILFIQVPFDTGTMRLYLDPGCLHGRKLERYRTCDPLIGRMANGTDVRFHTATALARALPPIHALEQAKAFFHFVTTHRAWFTSMVGTARR